VIVDWAQTTLNSITKRSDKMVHPTHLNNTYLTRAALLLQYRGQITSNNFFGG
jgi:hypothetical protein